MHISVRAYHDSLQDSEFNIVKSIFSSTIANQEKLFEIMETKSNDISYSSKKVEEFQISPLREKQGLLRGLVGQ